MHPRFAWSNVSCECARATAPVAWEPEGPRSGDRRLSKAVKALTLLPETLGGVVIVDGKDEQGLAPHPIGLDVRMRYLRRVCGMSTFS